MQLRETTKLFNEALKIDAYQINWNQVSYWQCLPSEKSLKLHTGLTAIGIMNWIDMTKWPTNEDLKRLGLDAFVKPILAEF